MSTDQVISVAIVCLTLGSMMGGFVGYWIGFNTGHAEGSVDTANAMQAALDQEPDEGVLLPRLAQFCVNGEVVLDRTPDDLRRDGAI